MFIDSHAHITSSELFPEVDVLLQRAKEAGVDKIVNICTDKVTLERGLALAEKEPMVVNTGATTPHDVEKEGKAYFSLFEEAAKSNKLVAIGETGLDYFYEHSNRDLQKEFLIRYLKLAKKTDLPVVIHCREAFDDLFAIADAHYGKPLLLHCFTGNIEEAKQGVDRGCLLSLSGILTFKKSTQLRMIAKHLPLESLLIETDAPYLAPQSHRGKKNEPSFLVETASVLAEIKGCSLEEVARTTSQNAELFFKL